MGIIVAGGLWVLTLALYRHLDNRATDAYWHRQWQLARRYG